MLYAHDTEPRQAWKGAAVSILCGVVDDLTPFFMDVTATRKRPHTFESVRGQEFIVRTLTRSLQQKKVASAYLFSGPHGVGKTSLARILAAALNAPGGPLIQWGDYPGLEAIKQGRSLDVIEIDGASHTGVADVRAIRDQILFPPVQHPYKIYIIDEVHMLSNSAFNALLKTIEEPPPVVVFIFATTELNRVPATVRSRCQQFPFRFLSESEIEQTLSLLCKEENRKTEIGVFQQIAYEARGSLRDAYMLFDQLAAMQPDSLSMTNLSHLLGLANREKIDKLCDRLLEGNKAAVLTVYEELRKSGLSPSRFIDDLLVFFRSLFSQEIGITRGIVRKDIEKYKGKISIGQIQKALSLILETERNIQHSLYATLSIELLLSELCMLKDYLPLNEIIAELRKMKQESNTDSLYQVSTDQKTQTTQTKEQFGPIEKKKLIDKLEQNNLPSTFVSFIETTEAIIRNGHLRFLAVSPENSTLLTQHKEILHRCLEEMGIVGTVSVEKQESHNSFNPRTDIIKTVLNGQIIS